MHLHMLMTEIFNLKQLVDLQTRGDRLGDALIEYY